MSDNKTQLITAPQLTDFLNINYQSFNSWCKQGILGDKFQNPGRGRRRQFDFIDICAAKIAHVILKITNRFSDAQFAVEHFRAEVGNIYSEVFFKAASNLYMFMVVSRPLDSNSDESTGVWFQNDPKPKFPFTGPYAKPTGAYIVVPIIEIIKEVQNLLDDLHKKGRD